MCVMCGRLCWTQKPCRNAGTHEETVDHSLIVLQTVLLFLVIYVWCRQDVKSGQTDSKSLVKHGVMAKSLQSRAG